MGLSVTPSPALASRRAPSSPPPSSSSRSSSLRARACPATELDAQSQGSSGWGGGVVHVLRHQCLQRGVARVLAADACGTHGVARGSACDSARALRYRAMQAFSWSRAHRAGVAVAGQARAAARAASRAAVRAAARAPARGLCGGRAGLCAASRGICARKHSRHRARHRARQRARQRVRVMRGSTCLGGSMLSQSSIPCLAHRRPGDQRSFFYA